MVKIIIVDINNLIKGGKDIYDEMTATPYSIDYSWEHCHGAFLKIKNKYNNPKNDMTLDEMDFLCLSLGWYLASWGMLRNSFLNEYSHEIHKDAIQLIYDHRWDSLWDINYATLTQTQAKCIQTLATELEDTYKGIHHFERDDYQLTDTLKTKILLGTIACVPAYDRFFVCALRHSLNKTNLCAESLFELREVYTTYRNEFTSMQVSIPPFESRVSGEGEPPVRRLGASVPVAGASGLEDQFQYWVVYFFNSVFLKWSTLFSAF